LNFGLLDLLDLLRELVPKLSAHDQDKLFKLVLKPDVLIVMANHAAVRVRIAVVQVCSLCCFCCLLLLIVGDRYGVACWWV